MARPKELDLLIKEAECQGWQITYTKNDHLKWTSPWGKMVFSASTPSDWRAIKNIRRDLRLYGFIELKRKKKGNK